MHQTQVQPRKIKQNSQGPSQRPTLQLSQCQQDKKNMVKDGMLHIKDVELHALCMATQTIQEKKIAQILPLSFVHSKQSWG